MPSLDNVPITIMNHFASVRKTAHAYRRKRVHSGYRYFIGIWQTFLNMSHQLEKILSNLRLSTVMSLSFVHTSILLCTLKRRSLLLAFWTYRNLEVREKQFLKYLLYSTGMITIIFKEPKYVFSFLFKYK